MDNLSKFLEKLRIRSRKERRQHPRETCFIEAGYMVQNRWYRGSIQDMSAGGAYVHSSESRFFSPGEDILLVAQIRVLRDQVRGKIAWVGLYGMGVEFRRSELDYRESEALPDDSYFS
jgi:hypothetical protein